MLLIEAVLWAIYKLCLGCGFGLGGQRGSGVVQGGWPWPAGYFNI